MTGEQFIIQQRDSGELRRMSEWWEASRPRAGLDAQTAMRVDLCLNEAVGNVLEHGYRDGADVWVRISVTAADGGVRIVLEDTAPAYDPLRREPVELTDDLELARPGGRGVHLMRRYTECMEYRREAGRNRLSMLIVPDTD